MKKFYIVFLLLFLSVYSFGQKDVSYGVRFGGGISSLSGLDQYKSMPDQDVSELSTGSRFSWDLGLVAQGVFNNGTFCQMDALFSVTGASVDRIYMVLENQRVKKNKLSLSNFEVNSYIGKKMPLSDKFAVLIGAGPYADMHFTSGMSNSQDGTLTGYGSDFKFADFGAGGLAAVEYRNIQLAFNPRFGFTDLSADESKVRQRVYKLAVTYFFR